MTPAEMSTLLEIRKMYENMERTLEQKELKDTAEKVRVRFDTLIMTNQIDMELQ